MEKKAAKKSKNDIIIKILTVACILCAVLLVVVLVFAFVGGDDNVTSGNVTPDTVVTDPVSTTLPIIDNNVLTTAPVTEALPTSTTLAANPNQITAYATEEVNIRSAPSTDATILGKLPAGGSVIFLSKDENDWCKVVYDGEICYIYREYLTTVKPAEPVTQPGADATTRKTVNATGDNWYIVIVDKNRQIPEGYVPATEYIADSDCSLDARIAKYYDAMYNAALEDGIELTPYSGYRSYETQEYNYNNLVDMYLEEGYTQEEAEAEAATEILPPGCSEHNLGLAIDIISTDYDFAEIYEEEYNWLVEHAHEYGFIERYTEEKQDITGIIPEPWHWRFVGKHATAIKNSGLCLEEYYQHYGVEY